MREPAAAKELVDAVIAAFGSLDVLVNNAGGQFVAPAEEISHNGFRAVMRLNLDAVWELTRLAAVESMLPNGYGKVISVVLSPRRGIPGMFHSSAARAAVESMTRTLATEWGGRGVRLTCVAPGTIDTEGWRGYGDTVEDVAATIPLGRLGTVGEVAQMIAFLASPAGDFVTGTTVVIDGGVDNVDLPPGRGLVSRPLGSVERAVALLEALAAARAPLGTNELARQTGINASTVSRVLATLLDAGLVEREPGGQRWQLGLRLVHLGNAALARLDLRDLARPLLEQLVRETGETATLSLPAQGEGVTVDFAPSPHSVSSRAEIGRASVAHATAVGKLVLAHTGGLASLNEPLERYTPRTLTTLAELEHAVAAVRAAGMAEAAGEREPGLNAIAAPVLADDGRLVAVLGIQGPERFDADARRAAAQPLARAAALLAATAGLRR